MSDTTSKSQDLTEISSQFHLDELLDRSALAEMIHSFEKLFGVPLRIYSATGTLLADAQGFPSLYSTLEKSAAGRKAVRGMIAAVLEAIPTKGKSLTIPCFSGANYLSSAIVYEGRFLGRVIVGPYVSPDIEEAPSELLELSEAVDLSPLREGWGRLARLRDEEAENLQRHLLANLELLIFTGLKAHFASRMHMASVQESFRELSEQNKKLQIAYDRLKELDRLKSNFLATVSHELRTPLTSIIGYSEMILEGIAGEINEEQTEFVGTIHEKGEQLLELIKSLLDLSKLESGTMSLRKKEVDCGVLAKEVVSTLAPTARKQGVTLSVETEKNLPLIVADANRLRQVLNNICENAIKFTPQSGEVKIGVAEVLLEGEDLGGVASVLMAQAQRPAIEIIVRDTGIGIPEGERERVFDAFYQVDSSSTRQVGGTGLGLSIVKRLVAAHDGTVVVEENQPCGAAFIITLPIRHR